MLTKSAAENLLLLLFFREKAWHFMCIILSAKQMIDMKCQALFSLKNDKYRMSSAAAVTSILRVKNYKYNICKEFTTIMSNVRKGSLLH